MKKIYIYFALIIIIAVALFTMSFFYIDRQGHQTFLYAVYRDNTLIGYEKMDRYLVENRLIYKSNIDLPNNMLRRKIAHKITFNANGKDLMDYAEEITENGAKNVAYVTNNADTVSFLGIANSSFTYLDKMPVRGNFTIFDREALVTYPPLIRRYNFKKRGEQFFNTMTVVSPALPPVPGVISITAIGRDIIDINDKRIKCENLVFELDNGELISVWVAQAFHSILMVKIPKYGFKAVLCTEKEAIPVEEYTKKSALYAEKEIAFKNDDIALSGILSIPNAKTGPYPAVLLIWDSGPLTGAALGMFTDIAHALSENSYCVFRFDKRGAGKSQGSFSAYDQAEEIDDLQKAVGVLKSIPEIDKNRIGVLGYSEGCFYAAHLAGTNEDVKGCIMLSPSASLDLLRNDSEKIKEFVRRNVSSDPQYIEYVGRALYQSKAMAQDQSDWMTIEGNSVFTKKVKMQDTYDMSEALKKIRVPVLIIHGKMDNINLPEEAGEIERILYTSGNTDVSVKYFGNLDHLLGRIVRSNKVREHIELDPEVTKSIVLWLDKNLVEPEPVEAEPADIIPDEAGIANQNPPGNQ